MVNNNLQIFWNSLASNLDTMYENKIKQSADLVEGSTNILHLTDVIFKKLLSDPVGPNLAIPPEFSNIQNLDNKSLSLVAVGVHSIGDFLPLGRHSSIFVEENQLNECIAWAKKEAEETEQFVNDTASSRMTTTLPNFLDLFNHVYGSMFGRNETLIHALLHATKINNTVIEIKAHKMNNGTSQFDTNTHGQEFRLIPISFPDVWNWLADDKVLMKLVNGLSLESATVSNSTSDEHKDQIRFYGNRVVSIIRDERTNPETPWYCIYHTLDKHARQAAYLYENERDQTKKLSLYELFGESPNSEHKSADRLIEIIRMFELFFLYRKFCGNWFYVMVPSPQQDVHLRVCYTFGTMKQLSPDNIAAIYNFTNRLSSSLRTALSKLHEQKVSCREFGILEKMLGSKVFDVLKDKAIDLCQKKYIENIKMPSQEISESQKAEARRYCQNQYRKDLEGLENYISFCRRLSEIAIHEGKKLHFNILVSGGLSASKMLAPLASLPKLHDGRNWQAVKHEDSEIPQADERTISALLGNYAFFQSEGVILLGCHEGRFLQTAQLFQEFKNPETITSEEMCYLLQVKENGDICVFYKGELLLWRQSGKYVVPRHYGEQYKKIFVDKLKTHFSLQNNDHIDYLLNLADVIWSLSAERRGGGTFVICKSNILINNTSELSIVLPHANDLPLLSKGSKNTLIQLASQDGAVVIDLTTWKVFGRRQLITQKIELNDFLKENTSWKDRYKVYRWGTRHHSALNFANSVVKKDEAAVIVVSADGDIHVFLDKIPDDELSYPE